MKRLFLLFFVLTSSLSQAASQGFLLFGDFGVGNDDQRTVGKGMVKFCSTHDCGFVIGLGDNFYPAGVRSAEDSKWKTHFLDIYQPLGLTFYASLGNHDYAGNVPAQIEFTQKSNLWQMPDRYFKFTKGDIEFFALDTNVFEEPQRKWLKEALDQSAAKWKIVYGHHPIYSYGTHGNTRVLVKYLLPMLRGKADYYLCGHEHDRQLLLEPVGPEKKSPPMVISGAAGQTRKTQKGPMSEWASDTLGFAHLQLGDTENRLSFVNAEGAVEWERNFAVDTVTSAGGKSSGAGAKRKGE